MDDLHNEDSSLRSDQAESRVIRARIQRRAQAAERKGVEFLERASFKAAAVSLMEAIIGFQEIGDQVRVDSATQYLALSLYEDGYVDKALELWEALVSRGWDRPTVFNFLIAHYERRGHHAEVERLNSLLEPVKGSAFGAPAKATPADALRASPEPTFLDAPQILVADKDPIVRKVLDHCFGCLGYRILFAEDGEEALDIIFAERPDLIFLDLYMPTRSGLDVLYRIRDERMDTPVVVISSRPDAPTARAAAALGAEFAGKPLNLDELERMVEGSVGKGRPESLVEEGP